MSEEEIKGLQEHTKVIINEGLDSEDDIQGILKKWVDLYNKEKATSHYIQSQLDIANAKLIELENADLTTVYMNGFYDGEKKWKDKIKSRLHDTINWLDGDKYTHYGLNPYELKAVEKELEFLLEKDNK